MIICRHIRVVSDFDTYDIGLFQTVVQYTADEAGEMAIIMFL